MQHLVEAVDRIIARIASRSHGVVTRAELLAAGITREQIRTRMRRGSLIKVHPGVYRVGHTAPTTEATYLAAVKACGEGAAISGRAAAHLHGLIRSSAPPPPEVTAPSVHLLTGVAVHESQKPLEVVLVNRIPTTTVPRTLIDLAGVLNEELLGRAVHEAIVKHHTKPDQVEAALEHTPKAKGAGTLRRILNGDTHITLSKLERDFLKLLRKHNLPLPETNRKTDGHYVDCRWPTAKLTVELDGYRFHVSRHAWEQDRRRERVARARGDEFRRYSYGDIADEATAVIAELRTLLKRSIA